MYTSIYNSVYMYALFPNAKLATFLGLHLCFVFHDYTFLSFYILHAYFVFACTQRQNMRKIYKMKNASPLAFKSDNPNILSLYKIHTC